MIIQNKYLYLCIDNSLIIKKNVMKKVRTLKDLQNHPLVDYVEREYNPGAFDGYDYTYWLYLKEGYWFEDVEMGLIHEPTIGKICGEFNWMTISTRTDGW